MIKINELEVQNFKAFENIVLNFNESNFVVLDGPNGFGKTSIFDSIELLITGEIKRYNRLCDEVIDNRNKFDEHPFLCDTSNDGDLIISANISVNKDTLLLKRIVERTDLVGKNSILNTPSILMVNRNLNNGKFEVIHDEDEFFEDLIGKNYIRNFEFINYVEQEENLNFLKQKDHERKDAIAHLFKISDIENESEKLSKLYTKLNSLSNNKVKADIEEKEKDILELKKSITGVNELVEHKKLFENKSYYWDNEKINLKEYTPNDLLGKNSEFNNLKTFVLEFDDYIKHKTNQRIDKMLADKKTIETFLKYGKHISEYKNLMSLNGRVDRLLSVITSAKGDLTSYINSSKEELSREICEILEDSQFAQSYNKILKGLKKKIKDSNTLIKSLNSMKTARDNLIKKDNIIDEFPVVESICVLCGHDWKSNETLFKSIEVQTQALKEFMKISGDTLVEELDNFKENYVEALISKLDTYIKSQDFDQEFFNDFQDFYNSKNKNKVLSYKRALDELKVQVSDLQSSNFSIPKQSNKNILEERLNERKILVSTELSENNDEVFEMLFDNKYDEVKKIKISDLNLKECYLVMLINQHKSSILLQKETDTNSKKQEYEEAKVLRIKVNKLKDIYSKSIVEYQTKVINDIEILFHLYSGRIVQDRKGGNGLYIKNDKGIRFLDKPDSTYDALFKLSSGQLAALIISFTLALNKKYSQDKLLLIDDPVQTLDDLNVAALIELLRNEFSDSQIFIATHEDMMSAYMRYKFEKYDIKTKRISLSEVQLSQN